MALLHAAARVARRSVSVVATFDHATGPAAKRAVALVVREATALGFPVVVGHAARSASSEAAWREMRLEFLNEVARRTDAVVATAHTCDDQVETVLMRVLRHAGARGLAGLFAHGVAERPLLAVSRAAVADYAAAVGASWVDDPTNESPKFLRNRVRRDLLPALTRAHPGFERDVLAIARDAADWRSVLESVVTASMRVVSFRGGIALPAAVLVGLANDELAVLWPAIAARAGARMDWRGTERAVGFTTSGRVGTRMPLSGGWEIARTRDEFELRNRLADADPSEKVLGHGLEFDRWTFTATAGRAQASDAWTARFPAGVPLVVRRWRAGDRMQVDDAGPRRVKRFLSDARIGGALRARWPVVLAGGVVCWIPGVRRGQAAAVRPGRRGVLFRCVLNDH